MKIRTKPQTQGSVLLVSLLTAAIIGTALGSYLTLTSNQNQSVFRSMTWNEAIPVSEAGIEEALTQIQYYGITNFSANGWTWGLDGCYHKRRDVGSSYYDVAIWPVDPPVITSTAYVRTPLTPSSAFGMILGTVNSGGTSNPYVKRRVQVTTAGGTAHGAAVISKSTINLSGNNVTIDSFISSDPRYSTNGMYSAALARDHGDVVTNAKDGLTSNGKPLYALDIGDADIKGHVSTGPDGTANVTSGGSVGDNTWVNAGTSGIKVGWSGDDANMQIEDVKEPFTGNYFVPTRNSENKVDYNYVLDQDGNYKLDGTLTGKIIVRANVTLWVTGDVNIGSGEFIEVAAGASLKLYVSGASAVIGGQGVVNDTGYAKNFQYYGLPTNTSIDYKGNSAFTGTINAPQAVVKLGGGGTTDYDFVGSIVANSVTMNGHFHIHYDEALQPAIPSGYVVSAWNEVDPNTTILNTH
jgi:hypothetical protein